MLLLQGVWPILVSIRSGPEMRDLAQAPTYLPCDFAQVTFPGRVSGFSNKNEGVEQIIAEATELRDLDCGVLVSRSVLLDLLHNNTMMKSIYSA